MIDYTREDFTKSGKRYDLIMGANVYHSMFNYRRTLSQDGICVTAGGRVRGLAGMLLGSLRALTLSLIGRKKMRGFITKLNKKDLVFLKDLLEARKILSVIDRRYPLSDVADAIRYLE